MFNSHAHQLAAVVKVNVHILVYVSRFNNFIVIEQNEQHIGIWKILDMHSYGIATSFS
jgi:hypothetical protein